MKKTIATLLASLVLSAFTCGHKTMFLGSFATEIEAAKAYDAMAIKIQGVFARPNFPQEIML